MLFSSLVCCTFFSLATVFHSAITSSSAEFSSFANITAPSALAGLNAAFGSSVSIYGSTLLVGSISVDPAGSESGNAFIYYLDSFDFSSSSTSEPVQLTVHINAGPSFGSCVSIYGDRAIVGDPTFTSSDGSTVIPSFGTVFIYTRDANDVWSLDTQVFGPDNNADKTDWSGSLFGLNCDLFDDKIIVSAQSCPSVSNSSCAFIFEYDANSARWIRTGDSLISSALDVGEDALYLGARVELTVHINDNFAVLSAPGRNWNSGAVSVFAWSGSASNWFEMQSLTSSYDGFASQCAISQEFVFVTAPPATVGGFFRPIVFVYQYDASDSSLSLIYENYGDTNDYSRYASVSVDKNGLFSVDGMPDVFVGRVNANPPHVNDGWVINFEWNGTDYNAFEPNLNDGDAYVVRQEFGTVVSVSGVWKDLVAVGDMDENKVYVFEKSVPTLQPTNLPSLEPTRVPSLVPTSVPSVEPTGVPSFVPSVRPSLLPTRVPSLEPSEEPTGKPSFVPSAEPVELEFDFEVVAWFEIELSDFDASDLRQDESLQRNVEKALEDASVESVNDIENESEIKVEIVNVFNNNQTSSQRRMRILLNNNNVLLEVIVGTETDEMRSGWIDASESVTNEFETGLSEYLSGTVSVDVVNVVRVEDLVSTTTTSSEDSDGSDVAKSETGATKGDVEEAQRQLNSAYLYVVAGVGGFLAFLTFLGVVDMKFFHNERFRLASFVVVFMYVMDFVSDVFFIGQVYFYNSEYLLFDMIVFGLAMLFVIVPILQSIIQLQKAIKKWRRNVDNGANIEAWMSENLRLLYSIVALTGGSTFCAIIIVNSNFFSMPLFDMSLSRRQQRVFRNKRVFSVVVLENVPQLVLQAAFSIKYGEWTIITIFATIFSLVSIFVTLFEFYTQRLLISSETYVVLKFNVECEHISLLNFSEFKIEIQNQRIALQRHIAQILGINPETVELLKPVQNKNGTCLTFQIQTETMDAATVKSTISQEIETNHLVAVLRKSWKFDQDKIRAKMNISHLETKTMHPELDDFGRRRRSTGATIVMSSTAGNSSLSTPRRTNLKQTNNTNVTMGPDGTTRLPSTSTGGLDFSTQQGPLPEQPRVSQAAQNMGGNDINAAFSLNNDVGNAPGQVEMHASVEELYGGNGSNGGNSQEGKTLGEGAEGAQTSTGGGEGVPRPGNTPHM